MKRSTVEKFNKKIDVSIKIIIFSSFIIFVIFFLVTTYQLYKNGVDVCFVDDCLGNFLEYYENTLKIPPATLAILTLIFLWHASNIYVHTYNTTHKNNLNTQMVNTQTTYLNHYKNFSEILDHYLSKVEFISIQSIDKFEFYHFIHNDSVNGDFNISQRYNEFIDDINNNILNLQNNPIRDKEYRFHIDEIVKKFSMIGFSLPNCPRKEFMKIEFNCYILLNLINKSKNIKEINSPSHCF